MSSDLNAGMAGTTIFNGIYQGEPVLVSKRSRRLRSLTLCLFSLQASKNAEPRPARS
jgi:hypothetical protein